MDKVNIVSDHEDEDNYFLLWKNPLSYILSSHAFLMKPMTQCFKFSISPSSQLMETPLDNASYNPLYESTSPSSLIEASTTPLIMITKT